MCAKRLDEFARAKSNIKEQTAHLGAITQTAFESAEIEWQAAFERRSRGDVRSEVDGVPVVIKDNIQICGLTTLAGSKVLDPTPARQDAECVARLRAAGAVIIAKTAMSEFAMEPYGTNAHQGTPRNFWGKENHRLPGGSSSGSAVAVASGMAPGALGTDTGGSTRLPAAWNGIVGLRPTWGTVPSGGVVPLSETLDVVGPMAKDVELTGRLYDVISADTKFRQSEAISTRDLNLASVNASELEDVDGSIANAFQVCLNELRGATKSFFELSDKANFRGSAGKSGFISSAEGAAHYGYFLKTDEASLDPLVADRLRDSFEIRAVDYRDAVMSRMAALEVQLGFWGDADCLMTPCSTFPPPEFNGSAPKASPSAFLRPVGYLGLCSIVVPWSFDDNGLPIGVQVVGRAHDEAKIFAVAKKIESIAK